jgi:hypothetical protein
MSDTDEMSVFLRDVRLWGRARAFTRLDHADRKRTFIHRQYDIAAAGAVLMIGYVLTGSFVFPPLITLLFTTGARECWRMRRCGRYWQCNRSLEVLGI